MSLFRHLPYDPVRDFLAVSMVSTFANVLATNFNSRHATLTDFIATARAQPGELNIGTTTVGSTNHLAASLFKSNAGLDIVIVPYRTPGDLLTAAVRNDVDLIVQSYGALKTALEDRQIRALATTTAGRAALAARRSVGAGGRRSGFRGGDLERLLRAGADAAETIALLNRESRAVLEDPELHRRFLELGLEAIPSTPEELGTRMRCGDRPLGPCHRRGRDREAMRQRLRWVAGLAAAALVLALHPAAAPAQPEPDFSSRAIRIVSPFAAGSVSDISLRLVAERLGPRLRTQVLVDNQPTGGGTTAAQAVITAAPDGHTLALLSNATAVSVALFKRLPYDPLTDFVPVCGLSDFAYVLLTGTGSRLTSMADVLAAARARPGTLNFGTAAAGTTPVPHRAPPQEGGGPSIS